MAQLAARQIVALEVLGSKPSCVIQYYIFCLQAYFDVEATRKDLPGEQDK